MLGSFSRQESLKFFGRIALRLALKEVVEITNRVHDSNHDSISMTTYDS